MTVSPKWRLQPVAASDRAAQPGEVVSTTISVVVVLDTGAVSVGGEVPEVRGELVAVGLSTGA
jgi:hypothetical protein